ncbi:hypothetical protein [Desulfofustis limnaeus]|uniref:Uncharacterized protein n=1 Tax=Desulfofustis limnaeus TaxID=2740163 RepID=A0ABN6M730_9BACT|nr:hypothetical protein [Desulfofustis limnaeus]MDY0040804.1 hypothetical protein [Desulforhabdus sp.]BDD88666.1 hypothetical protein DPPLL_30310 [Desulfofustis limnaeus]
MLNSADFIVYLWILPVTLFILLPLALLSIWTVVRTTQAFVGMVSAKESVAPATTEASVAAGART